VTIPEEIRNAKRVNAEVERLLEQAREEAEQILAALPIPLEGLGAKLDKGMLTRFETVVADRGRPM